MDDAYIDDLFGESAGLPIPPASIPKGLPQRLDQLHTGGCCQRLAWSKVGCLAYINNTGDGIILRSLLCKSEDGSWTLGKEHPVPNVPGQQLVHLSWNHTGSELAIIDVFGRISIFSIFLVVNDIRPYRLCEIDPEDDQNAAAGLFWLHKEATVFLQLPAVKEDGHFSYQGVNHRPLGPFHPLPGKIALVVVTRNDTLRLLYQAADSKWLDISVELNGSSSSQDRITHAAFCPDKGNFLLLTTHSASGLIRVYVIHIQWNSSKTSPEIISPVILKNPVLTESYAPQAIEVNNPSALIGSETKAYVYPRLSHLDMTSIAPPTKHSEVSLPTITAVFSQLSTGQQYTGQQSSVCVLKRWTLNYATPSMHTCVSQLANKGAIEPPQKQFRVMKVLDETSFEKIVISVQYVNYGRIVVLVYSDGSVEFRARSNMELFVTDEDQHKISSMTQVGFRFPDGDPNATISPNLCALFTMDADGQSILRLLQLPGSVDGAFEEDARYTRIVVAISQNLAFSLMDHNNNDDLIAVLKHISNSALESDCLSQTYKALQFNMDLTTEPQLEKLFRFPPLRPYLSMQSSLGYGGEKKDRTLSAKVAWATLNLRQTALSFAYTFNSPKPGAATGPQADITKPEVLQSLFGVVKWFVDFTNFLMDELLFLGETEQSTSESNTSITRESSCAIPIVLASAPRVYLRYNIKTLRNLHSSVSKAFHNGPDMLQRQTLLNLTSLLETSAIRISQVDRVLQELDAIVKVEYDKAGVIGPARAIAEKELLLAARVPPSLEPVVDQLLSSIMDGLRKEIDRAALYFTDFSWLGLTPTEGGRAGKRKLIDALRKVPLKEGAQLRRCTRCCAVMQDVMQPSVLWLTQMRRACVCGSLWITME